jgi:hypothetical protein
MIEAQLSKVGMTFMALKYCVWRFFTKTFHIKAIFV